MPLNINLRKDMERWYELKDHPVQNALVNDDVRFKVVPAGRRSGKTERAKRYLAKQAMKHPGASYFAAAPTREQAKKIYWADLKRLCLTSSFPRWAVSESDLIIRFPNNSSISVIGLDKPERIEGQFWTGGVVDEIGNCKPEAWPENISPALDTFNPANPDYRAWCWLIGVPEGLNHYYDIAEYARTSGDPQWKYYHWKSADILPSDVIEEAKRRMSARQFRQEYEASFETAGGRIYEDYGDHNLVNDWIRPHEQLLWFHDFNFTPMSSGIGVIRNKNELHVLDEIVLESAVARQSAEEFVDRYRPHGNRKILLFGDPAGRAGEKHGHPSDYVEIESVLKQAGWTVERRVKKAAPAIRDRQNALRAKIMNAAGEVSLFVNPNKAKYLHRGLSTLQFKKGSTFLEEDGPYQHITTAIGYCVELLWPVRREQESHIIQDIGSLNYY